MLDSGVIIPSNSEWASPSVLICKKDGTVHWCIDFQAVNAITCKDAFPIALNRRMQRPAGRGRVHEHS